MTKVDELKAKFEASKKAVSDCQTSIAELQRKSDTLQESLPGLSREIENAEKAKTVALDAFALSSNKQTEAALKAARQAHEDAQKTLSESHELVEAINRTLTKQQMDLTRLNNIYDLAKRECWQSVFDEIRETIPGGVVDTARYLFVCGAQTGQTRQWILDSLFQNPSSEEFQEVRKQITKKYGIE